MGQVSLKYHLVRPIYTKPNFLVAKQFREQQRGNEGIRDRQGRGEEYCQVRDVRRHQGVCHGKGSQPPCF